MIFILLKTESMTLELRCKITGNDTMVIYNVQNVGVLNNVIGDIVMTTVIARNGWVLLCFVSIFQLVGNKCFYVLIVDGTAIYPYGCKLSGSL